MITGKKQQNWDTVPPEHRDRKHPKKLESTCLPTDHIDKVRVIREQLEEQSYDLQERLGIALDRLLDDLLDQQPRQSQ